MSNTTTLSNARIVCSEREIHGSVRISDGLIQAVSEETAATGIDLEGDYLFPGFIDVHTDHFEKHAMPRSSVTWNLTSASCAHDASMIAAGTTTVFDSLLAGGSGNKIRRELLIPAVKALDEASDLGLLRADHFLHIRCDIVEKESLPIFEALADNPKLKFVTIIDDLPEREDAVRAIKVHENRRGLAKGTLEYPFEPTADEDFATATARRERITELCQARGIHVANHDDTKAAHADQAARLGAKVSEFPLTMEAVEAAYKHGQQIICGSPNLVRGKSHNNMVAVSEIVRANMLGVLCSDYIPGSILQAIFLLTKGEFGWSLPDAVALATRKPAELFGLSDRGAIASGRIADLIRVRMVNGMPTIHTVWKNGDVVFTQRAKPQSS